MLILLAESKTMCGQQKNVDPKIFNLHTPVLEENADSVMNYIATLNIGEVSDIMKVSYSLASKTIAYAYDFPNKTMGYEAIHAFIGDAYRGLDINSLNDKSLQRANTNLRIISSLYGILKPDDIIKPYRLEFNKDIFPNNSNSSKKLKPKVTVEVVKYIKENNIKEIIDLLPADADACLDWKIIRAYAKVYKINFKTIGNGIQLKTPIAKRLKELRGIMCRTILEQNIDSFLMLSSISSPHFLYSPKDSKPGLPVFLS